MKVNNTLITPQFRSFPIDKFRNDLYNTLVNNITAKRIGSVGYSAIIGTELVYYVFD